MRLRKLSRRRRLRVTRLEGRYAPAGALSLVSAADPSLYADTGGGASYVNYNPLEPALNFFAHNISADGRYTAFVSAAPNLLPGEADVNGTYDVFLFDKVANTSHVVSHQAGLPLACGNGASGSPSVS